MEFDIMDLLEGKPRQRYSVMHNWGSAGSITLTHPSTPTPTQRHVRLSPRDLQVRPTSQYRKIADEDDDTVHLRRPPDQQEGRDRIPEPGTSAGEDAMDQGGTGGPKRARNRPEDAMDQTERQRLKKEDDEELDHIRVEHQEPRCCNNKYTQALKHLLPFRPPRRDKSLLPGNNAGLFSYFSINWLSTLMWRAYKKGLDPQDLWTLQHEDGAELNSERLERLWNQEQEQARKEGKIPQLWRAVMRSIRTRVIVSMVISIVQNLLQFLGPSVMLKLVLDYIHSPGIDIQYASLLVVGIAVINICRGACFNAMFVTGSHTATRITGALQAVMYKKVLRLKTGGERLSAQVINFYNNDMERIYEACISSVFITAMPVMFTLSVAYSVYIMGPWALLGQGVYILFYPIMGAIAKAQSRVRVSTVKHTDKRVALMTEILNSMRLIKMYSWEDSFAKTIGGIRDEEMKKLRTGALLQSVSSTVTPSISILATIITLLGYTLSGNPLSASDTFTIFSMFNAMQFTVGVLPFTVRSIAEAKISLNRIQKLLQLPEHHKNSEEMQSNKDLALEIKDSTFSWEINNIDFKGKKQSNNNNNNNNKDNKNGAKANGSAGTTTPPSRTNGHLTNGKPNGTSSNGSPSNESPAKADNPSSIKSVDTLFNINMTVKRGKLIGVCGSIGSGKSSLISAICGDMKIQCGDLSVNGKLALVTQQAWIYNDTFRENLLVGQKLEPSRYRDVLRVCSLESDIALQVNGEMTEIGERGVNLSGGQKQRINLARAVYSDRDIYLLDDPLSAVDTKVAQHIFDNCIKGTLSTKTVIFVTHATHFLEKCDEIVVMQGGRIVEHGTHRELIDHAGEYFEMVRRAAIGDEEEEKKEEVVKIRKDDEECEDEVDDKKKETEKKHMKYGADEIQEKGKLTTEETRAKGSVSAKVYTTFIKVSGGWCITLLILLAIMIFTLSRLFSAIWLQIWINQGDGKYEMRLKFMADSNQTFTDDELRGYITDNPLLWMYQLVYSMSFVLLLITGIIKGIGVTFRVLIGASRLHSAMFNSILRAPMSFFDTTPTGRILNRFSRDLDELDVRVPFFLEFLLQGILFVLGQILLVCFIYIWFLIPFFFIAVLFIVFDLFLNAGVRELKRLDNTLKSPVTQHLASSITGLSIIRTFDKENLFTKRMYTYLDKHSVAVLVFRLSNRWFTFRMDLLTILITVCVTIICVFTKGVVSTATAGLALSTVNGVCVFIPFLMRMKSEFQSRITSVERIIEYAYNLPSEAPREIPSTKIPQNWPSQGAIELRDVKLRYRPDLPLVLHGITASIKSGEKIGIVGRTGAGKSSLISTILRLCELDSGVVEVDGIDISTLGLHTLRASISVIPQDPVLFQGTIRYNLDPFDENSDEAIWQALERSHLKAIIGRLEFGLMSKVEAAGENFSVGERQLICLTRALLRNSKILLLDEATASVDHDTDALIQATIREAFETSTVLTIAHRLNTVATYDRIMVLDAGRVTEFSSPEDLMLNESSLFREMMEAMGVTTVEQMKALT